MDSSTSKYFTIPLEIWSRKDISFHSKILWAEIRSLHCKEIGGCYANEEYFCEFLQLKPRRVYELHLELTDIGLLEVVSFDGRRIVRKAIVPNE